MGRFLYRVYYDAQGERGRSDPFWSRKSDREIAIALAIFPTDLRQKLAAKDILIQVMKWNSTTIDVIITGDSSDSEVREAVRRTLHGLGLSGDELF